MKSGRRACSPDGFRSFLRGGQAAKPLCSPTTRNAERSEYGVLLYRYEKKENQPEKGGSLFYIQIDEERACPKSIFRGADKRRNYSAINAFSSSSVALSRRFASFQTALSDTSACSSSSLFSALLPPDVANGRSVLPAKS